MIRVPFPADVNSSPRAEYTRTLCERHPYLRSSSVCLTTATSGDAAEIAAQKRIDRWFVRAVLILALIAAPFVWS